MHLGPRAGDHDNNFNLLRMVAAAAVLFSHCFALTSGSGEAEPLRRTLGMTPGTIAVDVFFVASGFLVTASLLGSGSLAAYLRARALRIFPALWVATLLTVLAAALCLAAVPAVELLAQRGTRSYLLKNLTLLFGVRTTLPGVLENVPFAGVLNGSLWTLPYELRLYLALAGLWLLLPRRAAELGLAVPLLAASCMAAHLLLGPERSSDGLRFTALFMAGAALQLWRERVRLDARGVGAALVLLAASALWHVRAFHVAYHLLLPWLVVVLAHAPCGPLRAYNRVGDYSYGTYIYAFPVQQACIAAVPGLTAWGLLPLSLAATLALAVLSWHLVEKPALRLKRRRTDSPAAAQPPGPA